MQFGALTSSRKSCYNSMWLPHRKCLGKTFAGNTKMIKYSNEIIVKYFLVGQEVLQVSQISSNCVIPSLPYCFLRIQLKAHCRNLNLVQGLVKVVWYKPMLKSQPGINVKSFNHIIYRNHAKCLDWISTCVCGHVWYCPYINKTTDHNDVLLTVTIGKP